MKAYKVGVEYGISSLKIADVAIPALSPGQVLVKLKAVSLNYRDLLVVKGIDRWKPPVGRIPVSDGIGTVTEVGAGVTAVKPGERVAGLFYPKWIDGGLTEEKLQMSLGGSVNDGLLTEYAIFYEHEVIQVPDYLTDEEAATLPCAGLTAWHGLMEKGPIKAGNTVLIQGTGGVSIFSAQFAMMMGANVILLSGSNEKLERVKAMGIDKLINYKEQPNWETEVLRLTDGRGADHIVEVVGSDNINKSIEAVAYDGVISVIGLLGGLSGIINTERIMSKQIKLQGIQVGSKEMFGRMNSALEASGLHPLINKIFSFREATEALTYLEQSKGFGKICLKIN